MIGPKYYLKSSFRQKANYENVFWMTSTCGSASSSLFEIKSSTRYLATSRASACITSGLSLTDSRMHPIASIQLALNSF